MTVERQFPHKIVDFETARRSAEFMNGIRPLLATRSLEEVFAEIFNPNTIERLRRGPPGVTHAAAHAAALTNLAPALHQLRAARRAYPEWMVDESYAFVRLLDDAILAVSDVVAEATEAQDELAPYTAGKKRTKRGPIWAFSVELGRVWGHGGLSITDTASFAAFLRGVIGIVDPYFLNENTERRLMRHVRETLGVPPRKGRPKKRT